MGLVGRLVARLLPRRREKGLATDSPVVRAAGRGRGRCRPDPVHLTECEALVLRYLDLWQSLGGEPPTGPEIGEDFNRVRSNRREWPRTWLVRLEAKGLVERAGRKGRTDTWRITERGAERARLLPVLVFDQGGYRFPRKDI